jgi:hypothetical protein
MPRRLFTLAGATLALSLQPVAACETTGKAADLAHPAALVIEAEAPVDGFDVALPSIDSLTVDSDFTVFMKPGVSKEVQNMALRKLWRLNPAFGRTDGLDSNLVETDR